jgi:hypothetical protein
MRLDRLSKTSDRPVTASNEQEIKVKTEKQIAFPE